MMHLEQPVDYDNTLQKGGCRDTQNADKRMEKEFIIRITTALEDSGHLKSSTQLVTSLAAIDTLSLAALADQLNTGLHSFDFCNFARAAFIV